MSSFVAGSGNGPYIISLEGQFSEGAGLAENSVLQLAKGRKEGQHAP